MNHVATNASYINSNITSRTQANLSCNEARHAVNFDLVEKNKINQRIKESNEMKMKIELKIE